MSEKWKPSHSLEKFQQAFGEPDSVEVTTSAIKDAMALGIGEIEMNEVKVWQDVYHVPSGFGDLYVKFTEGAVTEFRLLSFKERQDG